MQEVECYIEASKQTILKSLVENVVIDLKFFTHTSWIIETTLFADVFQGGKQIGKKT